MKPTATLLILALAACVPGGSDRLPPRAEVVKLDAEAAQLSAAGNATSKAASKSRDAVRDTVRAAGEAVAAGERTELENANLLAQIARLEIIAAADGEMTAEFPELKRIANAQAAAIAWWRGKSAVAEAQAKAALATVDEQAVTIEGLQATILSMVTGVASQSPQIDQNKKTDEQVREIAQDGLDEKAKQIITEDKLTWWRWYGAGTSLAIALLLAWTFRRFIFLLFGVPIPPRIFR